MVQPLSLDAWRQLVRQDPPAAAARVRSGLAALPAAQQRALLAWQPAVETLAAELSRTAHGPLGGVPYLLKDLFHVAGVPTMAGGRFLDQVLPAPESDGALVTALRAAGAALAGKTHLHEYAYGLTGENLHHGDVEHPHAPGRTSGGSSSGSAAAVAAGVVPLAIGTDTGGSIRVPSAFCGVYGFRMTPHHAWIADGFPLAPSFDTAGWFTRTAADMGTTLAALLHPDRADRAPRGLFLDLAALGQAADPDFADTVRRAGQQLAPSADAATAAEFVHAFEGMVEAYAILQSTEAFTVHAAWLDARRADYEPGVWQRIDRGRRWTPAQQETAHLKLAATKQLWARFFSTYDYVVLPATPFPALTKSECTLDNRNRLLALTAPASLGGLPVLTVPVPLTTGLSAGLQIVVNHAASPVLPWVLDQAARQDSCSLV